MAKRLDVLTPLESATSLLELDGVQLFLGTETHGTGKLSITDVDVAWWSADRNYGYAVNYPDLMLHAVSRDVERFPEPCVFCYLDLEGDDASEVGESRLREVLFMLPQCGSRIATPFTKDETVSGEAEMRFVPADANQLDAIYTAMCQGQAANPDMNGDDDDDDDVAEPEGFDPASVGLDGAGAITVLDGGENGVDGSDDEMLPMAGGLASRELNDVGQANFDRIAAGLLDGMAGEDEADMFEDAD
ncbi:uncharacterized protein MONBRDRAFT_12744 [Monosiga brevicollis MX1]|uniref:Methylosome subunit pICln n=1 Tax=Monosiga brevicollis TaxID=81824 RepID=A9VD70_MONBE|nr:uncharacterized protein MONBRDRAFT_12744 [Monosiga brevicollis MX1]EDQ84478.1 predicted protein [Monosiga brevicollis MX1]|eukprot:XP_001750665.1 hypothetical protein [Monosiga brevicollis MX1]